MAEIPSAAAWPRRARCHTHFRLRCHHECCADGAVMLQQVPQGCEMNRHSDAALGPGAQPGLPGNLLQVSEMLVPHVPARFRGVFEMECTLKLSGAANQSRRLVEVCHPQLVRYFIIRQNGVCLLLERPGRPNSTASLQRGIVHTNHRELPDSDSESGGEDLETTRAAVAFEWMFERADRFLSRSP